MKIATRLYLGFSLLLALLIGVTLVSVVEVGFIDRTLTQVNEVDSSKQRYAINFRGSVHDRAIAIRDAVSPSVAAVRRSKHVDEIRKLDTFYQESAKAMERLLADADPTAQELQLLDDIKAAEAETVRFTSQALALLNREELQQAQDFVQNDVAPAYTLWLRNINAFIDYQEAEIERQLDTVRDKTGAFKTLMLVATSVCLLIGMAVSYSVITRLISTIGGEPEAAARQIKLVAEGDLTQSIATRYPDSMMGAVATMTSKLAAVIREVNATAGALVQASDQLSTAAGRTQSLMETQRQQTQQGAAAIAQMAATVQEVARHTVDAANVAQTADEQATSGSREVEKTITSIDALAEEVEAASQVIIHLSLNSGEIGSVLEVIQNIAGQTNLLALNAAIEAARAGEHGRGFAVVADEVRALAQRTQASTRDIQELIDKMQGSAQQAVKVMELGRNKAAESVSQARSAGQSLQKINESVGVINDMNAQIATAAEEQTMVAEEINRNINSISSASEQAAAGAEQTSLASRELVTMAARLQKNVVHFKV